MVVYSSEGKYCRKKVLLRDIHMAIPQGHMVLLLGGSGAGKTTYVNAIRQVAEHYGLPVVDLFRDCKIQPQVEALKERYAPDGLHPNDAGHELICQCLLNVLERL